jgi:hypothetical protein
MKKKLKKVSPTPMAKKVVIKEAKPKAKSPRASVKPGGFVRLSETHIRKVYC